MTTSLPSIAESGVSDRESLDVRAAKAGARAHVGCGRMSAADGDQLIDLLRAAAKGDGAAWSTIVDRYSRLVWSVVRGFGLYGGESEDVFQTTWLRLVENLDRINDPARLPGWLRTTALNECRRVVRRRRELPAEDAGDDLFSNADALDVNLLRDADARAVAEAFNRLGERDQQLMRLLFSDPPTPYAEIEAILGMPPGAIGPTRQRCLRKLREDPALRRIF